MTRLIVLIAVAHFSATCEAQTRLRLDSLKVDSVFARYFDILESYLARNDSDNSLRRIEVISNLERLSHIDADGDGTYIGRMSFSRKNLVEWKDWYAGHRQELEWNNERGRIQKRPIEKTIEFKFPERVDGLIRGLIESQIKRNANVTIYMYLRNETLKSGGYGYKVFVEAYSGQPLDYLLELVNVSPRFYRYKEIRIPICADFDLDFLDKSSKAYDRLLRSTLKNSSNIVEFSID